MGVTLKSRPNSVCVPKTRHRTASLIVEQIHVLSMRHTAICRRSETQFLIFEPSSCMEFAMPSSCMEFAMVEENRDDRLCYALNKP